MKASSNASSNNFWDHAREMPHLWHLDGVNAAAASPAESEREAGGTVSGRTRQYAQDGKPRARCCNLRTHEGKPPENLTERVGSALSAQRRRLIEAATE